MLKDANHYHETDEYSFILSIILLGYVEHSGGEPSLSPVTVTEPDSND